MAIALEEKKPTRNQQCTNWYLQDKQQYFLRQNALKDLSRKESKTSVLFSQVH